MGWLWLIVIGVVIYAIYRKIKKNTRIIVIKREFPHDSFSDATQKRRPFTHATGQQTRQSLSKEAMVQCVHCQVYIPRSSAIVMGEKYFCCENHKKEHLN